MKLKTAFLLIAFFSLCFPVHAADVSLTARVNRTSFEFAGFTSPNSIVTFSEDNAVIGTTTSDADGAFDKQITILDPGLTQVVIWSTDPNNLTTLPIKLDLLTIAHQQLPVINLYLPPTIKSNGNSFNSNETLIINGYAKPDSSIELALSGNGNYQYLTQTDANGYYAYNVPAGSLNSGTFVLTAKLLTESIIDNSTISSELLITVNKAIGNVITPKPLAPVITEKPCPYYYDRICLIDVEKIGEIRDKTEFITYLENFIRFLNKNYNIAYDINRDSRIGGEDLSIVLYHLHLDSQVLEGISNIKSVSSPVIDTAEVQGASVRINPNPWISIRDLEIKLVSFTLSVFLLMLLISRKWRQETNLAS